MNYRRIPGAVLIRNPELYYNYLYPDVKNTYSEGNNLGNQNPENQNSELLEEPASIPLPNKEQEHVQIEEKPESITEKKGKYPEQRSFMGLRTAEFGIVILVVLILIICFN